MNSEIIRNAQVFASRWGFLTKDIFFDFICGFGRSQCYEYWSHLVASGLFIRSAASDSVLLLSLKSRRSDFGKSARPSRLPTYIEHDAIAAKFLLTLERTKLISAYWLEDELLRDPMTAYQVLGAERLHRIPDMVFDLKTATGTLRCALEVEKTAKTQARYSKMALTYLGYKKIGITLFACGNAWTENAVRRAFQGRAFTDQKKIPGLYQYSDFEIQSLEAPIRFGSNQMPMREFLEIATKKSVDIASSKTDLNRTSVRFRKSQEGEAA
ncbi:MAG: hypothetical protein AB7K41_04725 [Bdellovibrionales bacterium]